MSATVNLVDVWNAWTDRKVYNHFCHLTHRPIESWQIDDWQWLDTQTDCCILRSRKASKTTDLMDWLILRLLRHPTERWGWFASKTGQLVEALGRAMSSMFFVKKFDLVGKTYILLCNGAKFVIGSVTTSQLGLFLDGIIYDEQQDLDQPKQSDLIYPQFHPMLAASPIHREIHVGTRWVNTRFDEECDTLPCKIRDYTQAPWLVKAGFVEEEIKKRPSWEIDLLYRCIRTAPYGLLFSGNLHVGPLPIDMTASQYGFDFGAQDVCVGLHMPDNRRIYVCSEQIFDMERNPSAAAPLRFYPIEGESGGYNDMDKYGKKSAALTSVAGAVCVPCTNEWKAQRQQQARECEIYIDPNRTPMTYKDAKAACYDADGLYKKSATDPAFGMHYLDAMFHGIGARGFRVWGSQREKVATSYVR